ncbi:PEP-CTERM sorting domain-containing protein [Verrucomicrobiaceae bacterium N1E253]|uniref:PEP-CTERM sorting domain-containing protein n=1 Tax=Oceaniferula marina TaxID=2748318 RepID=A0A851GL18_9BACT|nr:PEP-CTERM sorting domain-containing protein [Oceaniferula marina]NWK55865.1 PEP-CTERM sorting domain-containing protein [Oceaniferula marina]
MKNLTLGTAAALALASGLHASTTYIETFTNDSGTANQNLAHVGWKGYYGNNSGTPSVADTYTNNADFGINSGNDYFQAKQGWHSSGKHIETFIYTDEPGSIALQDITVLSVDIRRDFAGGSGANATARLALEIGGVWYVTDENRYSPRSSGDEATFTTLSIDPSSSLAAANWFTLADPSASLGLGAVPGTAFSGAETVTQYGVWFTDDSNGAGGTQWTKVDNFTVTSVPEPSSAVLLGIGGLSLVMRRRR